MKELVKWAALVTISTTAAYFVARDSQSISSSTHPRPSDFGALTSLPKSIYPKPKVRGSQLSDEERVLHESVWTDTVEIPIGWLEYVTMSDGVNGGWSQLGLLRGIGTRLEKARAAAMDELLEQETAETGNYALKEGETVVLEALGHDAIDKQTERILATLPRDIPEATRELAQFFCKRKLQREFGGKKEVTLKYTGWESRHSFTSPLRGFSFQIQGDANHSELHVSAAGPSHRYSFIKVNPSVMKDREREQSQFLKLYHLYQF
jgi:hypothetical protein